MKHVLIAIPFILFASLITTKTSAQHAGIFVHALYAAPVGGISSDFYDGGAGVEGGILAGRKNTRFVGSIGYSHFFKDNSNSYGDKTYIPVKAGVRQYLPLNIIFLQADMGVGFVSQKNYSSTTPFTYDFQAGVKLGGFEAAIGWDNLHAKEYAGWSSWFTVKAGINLGF